MQLSALYTQTSIEKIKNSFVVNKVKEIVYRYDEQADIILFGSRARGDWHKESDWDFLVLTEKKVTPELKKKIIYDAHNIELDENILLQLIIKNKKDWQIKYLNNPMFLNIKEGGINV